MEQNNNEFTLVVGPMFAGKSKYLIENYYDNQDVQAFSPTLDTRDAQITSRAYPDKKIPCTKISRPSEMLESKANIIIADEYQFLGPVEELVDIIQTLKSQHKTIVMAGLDLLANGEEWSNYTVLKEICDKEIKLRAKCSKCKKPARFTAMISGNKDKKVQIEGEATYEPRCKEHYM